MNSFERETLMRKIITRTGFIAVSAVALTSVGVAFAAWTATGGGSGTSEATTAELISTVAGTTTAQLYPGGDGDLVIKLVNPNPYPVEIHSITGDGAITSDAGAACTASTGVSFVDLTGLELDVPANSVGTEHVLEDAVSMSNASHNDCQGAVFTVPVTVLGESDAP
jgi:hypothetical protein